MVMTILYRRKQAEREQALEDARARADAAEAALAELTRQKENGDQ